MEVGTFVKTMVEMQKKFSEIYKLEGDIELVGISPNDVQIQFNGDGYTRFVATYGEPIVEEEERFDYFEKSLKQLIWEIDGVKFVVLL